MSSIYCPSKYKYCNLSNYTYDNIAPPFNCSYEFLILDLLVRSSTAPTLQGRAIE